LRTAALAGDPYRLCITDLDMPGVDGLELAKAIRDDPLLAAVRIVLLGSVSPVNGDPHWRTLVDAYATKPVRHGQLQVALLQALGAAEPPPPAPTQEPPAGPMRSRRVLVAEDNPVNQHVALRMLERLSYQAETVANGEEAVAAVMSGAYDLVLMDCLMPVMDGYEAARQIRQREREGRLQGHLPIIAMTALAMAGDAEKSLEVGMDDHIPKPVTLERLATALARWAPLVPQEDRNESQ
jgi:CheY-like chemotaxis protein